jgi:hypothetical protein
LVRAARDFGLPLMAGKRAAPATPSGTRGASTFAFSARVVQKDMYFGVDIPVSVSRAIGMRGFVPIVGTANGEPLRTTLAPSRGGRHLLLFNRQLREAAGIVPGKRVALSLRVDMEPPVFDIAEDLADALREEGVLEDFETMARGRRNQFIQWMEQAVHEETRAKRIVRLVEMAHAQREKRIDRETKGRRS